MDVAKRPADTSLLVLAMDWQVGGREGSVEAWVWTLVELLLVRILVVVATIQMRTLKTEVEKGFMRTAIGHEWLGPKPTGNPATTLSRAKGYVVKIPQAGNGYCVATQLNSETSGRGPRESSLFFLTSRCPGGLCDEIGLPTWQSSTPFVLSGAPPSALENLRETLSHAWPYQ